MQFILTQSQQSLSKVLLLYLNYIGWNYRSSIKVNIIFKGLMISSFLNSEALALQVSVSVFYPVLFSSGMSNIAKLLKPLT